MFFLNFLLSLIPRFAYAIQYVAAPPYGGSGGTGSANALVAPCNFIPLKMFLVFFLAGIVIFCIFYAIFVNKVIERKWLFLLKVVLSIAFLAAVASVGYWAYQDSSSFTYCRSNIFKNKQEALPVQYEPPQVIF